MMSVSALSPRRWFPGARFLAMRRDPIKFFEEQAREHGDVSRFRFGSLKITLFNHPNFVRELLVTQARKFTKGEGLRRAKILLGEGLLTSEGEFHLRQRRLAQPAFHRQRIAQYAETMAALSASTSKRWAEHIAEPVEIHAEMMRLTLAIVAQTLFSADVEGEADAFGRALTESMNLFRYMTLPFAQFITKLPLPQNLRFRRARARLDATIYRIIRERRADGVDRGDLLSMLLLASDTEGDGTGMSDVQLRDEALTLFLAGHETTANALTFAWYLLSQNPDAEAKMHEEIARVLGTGDVARLPSAEDYPKLTYTEMVLAEVMRLYPPAWIVGRRALEDVDLNGCKVPESSICLVSQWLLHRDPRFFPEPERFLPERWTPEARAARDKYCYFPFGDGPRKCIGEQFAWMEGVIVLATLAQRWKLQLVPGVKLTLKPSITLRPAPGLRMVLARR